MRQLLFSLVLFTCLNLFGQSQRPLMVTTNGKILGPINFILPGTNFVGGTNVYLSKDSDNRLSINISGGVLGGPYTLYLSSNSSSFVINFAHAFEQLILTNDTTLTSSTNRAEAGEAKFANLFLRSGSSPRLLSWNTNWIWLNPTSPPSMMQSNSIAKLLITSLGNEESDILIEYFVNLRTFVAPEEDNVFLWDNGAYMLWDDDVYIGFD